MSYRDQWLVCETCGEKFVFTVEEQRKQSQLGFEVSPPSVCQKCIQSVDLGPGPHEGAVKWFSASKGYGFIVQPNGEEIFFHRSSIIDGDPEAFNDGSRVTYLVEQSSKGPSAVDVALLEDD
ncbi:MAG: cold shock domain-containing protein [Anaerolineae bacterium]|nr:cold shock domain-containing protein [Anaerolineae bacterium]